MPSPWSKQIAGSIEIDRAGKTGDTVVELWVDGSPIAQPRQRHSGYVCKKTKRVVVKNYIPDDHPIHQWKRIVLTDMRLMMRQMQMETIDFPIAVDLVFVFPRPTSKIRKTKANHRYWHAQTPDKDNLEKAVLDSLNGVAWVDDAIVCRGETTKLVAGDGDRAGVAMRIRRLAEVLTWADSMINSGQQNKLFGA